MHPEEGSDPRTTDAPKLELYSSSNESNYATAHRKGHIKLHFPPERLGGILGKGWSFKRRMGCAKAPRIELTRSRAPRAFKPKSVNWRNRCLARDQHVLTLDYASSSSIAIRAAA